MLAELAIFSLFQPSYYLFLEALSTLTLGVSLPKPLLFLASYRNKFGTCLDLRLALLRIMTIFVIVVDIVAR